MSTNLLPVVSVSATQIMQHANAFGGNAVSITYGVGNNGWTSVSGSEIEVWGQGYVDLLARRGSTGLKYTFSDTLEAGMPKYDGSSFPWEIVNEELVFVDNGNNYAKKVVGVLNGGTKYVE